MNGVTPESGSVLLSSFGQPVEPRLDFLTQSLRRRKLVGVNFCTFLFSNGEEATERQKRCGPNPCVVQPLLPPPPRRSRGPGTTHRPAAWAAQQHPDAAWPNVPQAPATPPRKAP